MHCTWPMGPIESHEKKVSRKSPNMGLQAILRSGLDYIALIFNNVSNAQTKVLTLTELTMIFNIFLAD